MPHIPKPQPKRRITCINHVLRTHEVFEAALEGDHVRYRTLLARLDSGSLAWLGHLIEKRGAGIPAPSLIVSELTVVVSRERHYAR